MTVLDDKIILFPSEKEFKIEFLIDEEVSMRGLIKIYIGRLTITSVLQSSKPTREHETICLRLYRCVRMDRVI